MKFFYFFRFRILWSSSVKSNTIIEDGNSFESGLKKKSSLLYPIDHHSDTISWNSESSDNHHRIVSLVNILIFNEKF
jgi:hypothetical protein